MNSAVFSLLILVHSIFHYFQDISGGWLLRRSSKRHLANNYIFVALGGFGKFSI